MGQFVANNMPGRMNNGLDRGFTSVPHRVSRAPREGSFLDQSSDDGAYVLETVNLARCRFRIEGSPAI